MGAIKKVVKKVGKAVGGVVKGAAGMLGLGGQDAQMPEIKTPAQQLERQSEVAAEDITMGTDDETSQTKGKRALLRPTSSSSLGGI